MRFTKISNNSIRCIISQKEMGEHGVELDDLMDNREKAEGFLRYILQEARTAVDFRTNGNVLNVQMSIMPDGDIALMISDDADSAIRNMLSEMKNQLQAIADTESRKPEDKKDPMLWVPEDFKSLRKANTPELSAEDAPEAPVSKEAGEEENRDAINTLPLWGQFDSLADCIHLAEIAPELKDVPSVLYQYDGVFFLKLSLTMTRRQLAGIAFKVAEYSNSLYPDIPGVMDIVEHGRVIIEENAMQKLYDLV